MGVKFREWTLGEVLGSGDSATVYSATDGTKVVAVKIFHLDALSKHGLEEETERIELQLSLVGQDHPNLVQVISGGVAEELDGTLFLVMELVPGRTLDKCAADVPRGTIVPLLKQLVEANRFLESKELVHRDIKPANIVISDDFTKLTLLDLGIVKNLVADDSGRLSGYRFVATSRYSPPEFVWRTEAESAEAWRAVTVYQI